MALQILLLYRYYLFNYPAWIVTQPQCIINNLLPWFRTCAFSDMDCLAILAVH